MFLVWIGKFNIHAYTEVDAATFAPNAYCFIYKLIVRYHF